MKMTTIELRELRLLKSELQRFRKLAGDNASMWNVADNKRKQAEALAASLGREVNEWRVRFDALIVRLPKLEA
jgi:hypothetical protein